VLADEPDSFNVTYSKSMTNIAKVVAQSNGACEQYISFSCNGATLGFTSTPEVANLTGWYDVNGELQPYWGAGLPSSGCKTGRTRTSNAGFIKLLIFDKISK